MTVSTPVDAAIRTIDSLAASLIELLAGDVDPDNEEGLEMCVWEVATATGLLERFHVAESSSAARVTSPVRLDLHRALRSAWTVLHSPGARTRLPAHDDLLAELAELNRTVQIMGLAGGDAQDDPTHDDAGDSPPAPTEDAEELADRMLAALADGAEEAMDRMEVLREADEYLSVAWVLHTCGQPIPPPLLIQATTLARRSRHGLAPAALANLETLAEHESAERSLHLDPVGTYLWTALLEPGFLPRLLAEAAGGIRVAAFVSPAWEPTRAREAQLAAAEDRVPEEPDPGVLPEDLWHGIQRARKTDAGEDLPEPGSFRVLYPSVDTAAAALPVVALARLGPMRFAVAYFGTAIEVAARLGDEIVAATQADEGLHWLAFRPRSERTLHLDITSTATNQRWALELVVDLPLIEP